MRRSNDGASAAWRRVRPPVGGLALAVGLVAGAGPVQAQVEMSVVGSKVQVKGVTPGGRVAFISLARVTRDYETRVTRDDAFVQDIDGDGQVEVSLREDAPPNFVAVAVDVETGTYGASEPANQPSKSVPLPNDVIKAAGDGSFSLVGLTSEMAELLLVRPTLGAWAASAGDGGEGDLDAVPGEEDHTNGKLLVSVTAMAAMAGGLAAPAAVSGADVLIVIDPRAMTYSVGRPLAGQ